MRAAYPFVLVLLLSPLARGGPPAVDGQFSEWKDEHLVSRDPRGDARGAFDLTRVAARSRGGLLYLHFDIGRDINLQNGPEDEGTLRLTVGLPGQRQLTIDFRKRQATVGTQRVAWSQLGYSCLPTHASDQYELQLDLRGWGLAAGDTVSLDFDGSDRLAAPVSLVLTPAEPPRDAGLPGPVGRGGFRIANLNTLRQGLSDPKRFASIQRLLAATGADIFCFQEEWEEDKFRRAAPAAVPGIPPDKVNLHWSGGCGIASGLKLQPLPVSLERGIASLVQLPDGQWVTVFVVHLQCCGYLGSREDQVRIRQATQLTEQLHRLRRGDFGRRAEQAGVVVIGDYNLVGSRKPLKILQRAELTDMLLRHPADGAAFTWRGLREQDSFWPGRLDLVMHGADLQAESGFILDTGRLSERTLTELGLRAEDSRASDHLVLVADFRRGR